MFLINLVIPSATPRPRILGAVIGYWNDEASRTGRIAATRRLLIALWEFLRDSTPSRLRQRYGDADYDWDYRVNTTSGAVGWRDRLLGVFHSPYQPTEPGLFHAMLDALADLVQTDLVQTDIAQTDLVPAKQPGFDFREFIFLDLGSGKGRTLLMASDYPFRRIVGVELLPSLDRIARENLRQYKNDSQKCFALESICADATEFHLPEEPLVMYLFNPFPELGLRQMMANLERSLHEHPRPVFVLYHNPLLERVLSESGTLRKIGGTHQYSIFGE